MKRLLLAVAVSFLTYCTSWGDDSRLIRRLYLDTIGMPPTLDEIEWYISYNKTKGYELAVDWVIARHGQEKLKHYFLSENYKQASPSLIPPDTLDNIIKYQVGNLCLDNKQATEELIKLGQEQYSDTLDTIDYFAMCIMSRPTRLTEANELLKIFRAFKTEKEGYKAVLECMKRYRDYKYK